MNTKSVSIYIPAYNAEKTIRNSLESIKNQTIPFDEIIDFNNTICRVRENLKIPVAPAMPVVCSPTTNYVLHTPAMTKLPKCQRSESRGISKPGW